MSYAHDAVGPNGEFAARATSNRPNTTCRIWDKGGTDDYMDETSNNPLHEVCIRSFFSTVIRNNCARPHQHVT